eukprot:gene18723-26427_t
MFRTTILLSIIAAVVADGSGSGSGLGCGAGHADLLLGNDDCCTPENQCGVDEGDCDSDNDCAPGLQCGYNNCPWGDEDDCCADEDYGELCQCTGGVGQSGHLSSDHGQKCTQDPWGGMYWCYLSQETIATCPDQRISPEFNDYKPWSELACAGGRDQSGAAGLAVNIGVVVMVVAAAALF